MKFGTGIDDDEQWLSKYFNHLIFTFKLFQYFKYSDYIIQAGRLTSLASLCNALDDAPKYLHSMHAQGTTKK